MKVLMTGLLPVNLEVKGGVVAANLNLFKAFNKIPDLEVRHVSFNREIKDVVIKGYGPNVQIHFLPFKSRFDLVDYLVNRKSFRKIYEEFNPDIVHIQEITPHLLRFLSLPRERVVVTQHGIMAEELKTATGLAEKLKFLLKATIEKYVFPKFKNVIFISDYNRNLFPGKAAHAAKIYNPVNPLFFDKQSSFGKTNSMIYIGVINRRKNLDLVLRAMRKLKVEPS